MAYSQFLQNKAFQFGITIDPGSERGKMVICYTVLAALHSWIVRYGYDNVLANVDTLQQDLSEVKNEFDTMYRGGLLGEFLQIGIITSITDLRGNMGDACSQAYAAGKAKSHHNDLAASQRINDCQMYIQEVIANIVIQYL